MVTSATSLEQRSLARRAQGGAAPPVMEARAPSSMEEALAPQGLLCRCR